jgi:hypothetical protein
MKRFLAITLAASAIALGLAACDSNDDDYWAYERRGDPCLEFATCGSCTPVMGCGWCSTSTRGACVSDPGECAGAESFSWTWDPSGCSAGADASVAPGADASAPDSAVPGEPTDSAAPVPDAGVPDRRAPADVDVPDTTPAADAAGE